MVLLATRLAVYGSAGLEPPRLGSFGLRIAEGDYSFKRRQQISSLLELCKKRKAQIA